MTALSIWNLELLFRTSFFFLLFLSGPPTEYKDHMTVSKQILQRDISRDLISLKIVCNLLLLDLLSVIKTFMMFIDAFRSFFSESRISCGWHKMLWLIPAWWTFYWWIGKVNFLKRLLISDSSIFAFWSCIIRADS